MNKLKEIDKLFLIILFSLLSVGFIYLNSNNARIGVISGNCSPYVKDFQVVKNIVTCPITIKNEKSMIISPSSLPNTVNSEVRFISRNGNKDLTILGYLMLPVFIGMSMVPLLLTIRYVKNKRYEVKGTFEKFSNIMFYIFLFTAILNTITVTSFLNM